MPSCDTLIRNAFVFDGSGADAIATDVAVDRETIVAIGSTLDLKPSVLVDAKGLTLAPGFIDTHTHDDLFVIQNPAMLPKISQGVTTVIAGNCGISAAPVTLRNTFPDPMNLLGKADDFSFPAFKAYVAAINRARPSVNVAALAGHTSLRNNHMDRLGRTATSPEIDAMRAQLQEALEAGALGLSTGLAYQSANAASTSEVMSLANLLASYGGIYTTHLRTEFDGILDAMHEAFQIGAECDVPVIISHLKCAGINNWCRSGEVIAALDQARTQQRVSCDCYPYAAGSSTLDLRQVDERVTIAITWSDTHPEMGGKTLSEIAELWLVTQLEAAQRLQPAGAIYHSISEDDMHQILRHPATMIGSDGLPLDPRPHPRLWGTFPRVLGRYCREEALMPMSAAIHKMTGLPAKQFNLPKRGLIREGYAADLVLFDAAAIIDRATYSEPEQTSLGIRGVWVNGQLSYSDHALTGARAGRFLARGFAEPVRGASVS